MKLAHSLFIITLVFIITLAVGGLLRGAGDTLIVCDDTNPQDCITWSYEEPPIIDSACTTKDCCLAYSTNRCRWISDFYEDPNTPIMFSSCLKVHFDLCQKGEHR